MSGHSKWNNIKRKKEKTDGARAKVFTKIGREIAVVVKMGGGDPNNNSALKVLIAKAKANNVPNDNIDRIIKKAAGDGDKNTYVLILQDALNALGYSTKTLDGAFGQNTYDALRAAQRSFSLTADGVCGCNTWKKLTSAVVGIGRTKTVID